MIFEKFIEQYRGLSRPVSNQDRAAFMDSFSAALAEKYLKNQSTEVSDRLFLLVYANYQSIKLLDIEFMYKAYAELINLALGLQNP